MLAFSTFFGTLLAAASNICESPCINCEHVFSSKDFTLPRSSLYEEKVSPTENNLTASIDAQQMDTNQLNQEHQQSDTVKPISKEIVTEHQESVTNEPALDNQSNQQNDE